MKIGLVQYDPVWEEKEKNKIKITKLLERDVQKSDLLLFPEMTLTGFTMESEKFGEELPGESSEFFSGIAKRYDVKIIAGIIEQDGIDYYNTLITLNKKGEIISRYRKIHPFSYSSEDKNYKRGTNPVTFVIDNFKIGFSICYDLRFPELFRIYGKERADLVIVIANWPDKRIDHWRTLLKARAVENQCYVAGVNRVGNDPKLKYPGFSCVYDPMGNEVLNLNDGEKTGYIEIDKSLVDEIRSDLPFLNDMCLI